MLSKLLFNFTTLSLIFYISASSAKPAAHSPSHAALHEINARETLPPNKYRPYLCQYPYAWKRRECTPSLGPRAWQDVCTYAAYHTQFVVEYDNRRGTCPENTFCMNTVEEGRNGKRFVDCVTAAAGSKRKREGPQIGASDRKRARPELGNTQFTFPVTVAHNMFGASVSGVVKSECPTVNVHRRMFFAHDVLRFH